MSEENEVQTEVEYDEVDYGEDGVVGEVGVDDVDGIDGSSNTDIDDFIAAIQNKEYNDAEEKFNDMIGSRLQDTLDQAKARIAGQIYNAEQELGVEKEAEES
jgi:hypothetical protein